MPYKPNYENKDAKTANARLVIAEFKGMAPSQDPHQGDPALSAIQVNCYALHPGQLRVRQGIKPVQFLT
jgi:hypothetical protein